MKFRRGRIPLLHAHSRGRQALGMFKPDGLELCGADQPRPSYEMLSDYEALRPAVASKGSTR